MQLHTHLSFDGNCREAFAFYQEVLGGEVTAMMTWNDGPMAEQVSPEARDSVMHACLQVGEYKFMGNDAVPGHPYQGSRGLHVVAEVGEPEEAERVFQDLSEAGEIEMPLQETFFARRFGTLVDRFGVSWMVNCEKEGES